MKHNTVLFPQNDKNNCFRVFFYISSDLNPLISQIIIAVIHLTGHLIAKLHIYGNEKYEFKLSVSFRRKA